MRFIVRASFALASLLTAADAPAQGGSPFSAARLTPRADSFVVSMQGVPMESQLAK